MSSKKKILVAFAVLVIVGVSAFFIRKHYRKLPGNPDMTLDQIVAERAKQVDLFLDSPAGKAFFTKNWGALKLELSKSKRPQYDLANIIRAGYIHSKIKDLTSADYNEIYPILIETLKSTPSNKDPLGYSLLLSQFERLPLPAPKSASEEQMLKIASDSKDPMHSAVLQKWMVEAIPVPPQFLKKFLNEFPAHTDEENRNWLATVDLVRDVSLQRTLLDKVLQVYPKLNKGIQAASLRTLALSQSLPSKSQQLKQIALQALDSQDSALIEGSLRIIPVLYSHEILKSSDRETIQKKINAIPQKLLTPYSNMKSIEVMKLLSGPQPSNNP